MATRIYLRRGIRSLLLGVVPESGEPVWATDTRELYVGDGVTSGGIWIAGPGVQTLNGLENAVVISGAGLVEVTEQGQVIIVSGEDLLDVDSLNGLTGDVTISGLGSVTVYEDGQVILVSGEASGAGGVESLNELTGDIDIVGAGTVTVTEDGQLIVISGAGGLVSHKDTHDPQDGGDPLDTAAALEIAGVQAAGEGSAHSFARSDHAHQIQHGITDDHLVTVDGAPASGEVAIWTPNGLEGYTPAEVMAILGGVAAENFSMNSKKIISLADPTENQDAATKKYVDDNIPSAFGQGAKVWRSTDQTIPVGAWTAIIFNLENFDNDDMWDAGAPTRLTVKTAGIYVLTASINWRGNVNGSRYTAIYVTGTLISQDFVNIPPGTGIWRGTAATIWRAEVNDYFELKVYQTGVPAGLGVQTNSLYSPGLAAVRIGPGA